MKSASRNWIIENPKPSRGSYADWHGSEKRVSRRAELERMIDTALEKAKDFDGFLTAMREVGCEVKRGKHLAFKIPGADRFARCKSLGEDYTEDAIMKRLAGQRKVKQRVSNEDRLLAGDQRKSNGESFTPFSVTRQTKFSLLIDIQAKIQEGKGAAYENWAKIYNLKQAARTLIYLQENGITSYDDLAEKSAAVSTDFNDRTARLREIGERQSKIAELQKQIGYYSKTRDVYKQYLKAGNRENLKKNTVPTSRAMKRRRNILTRPVTEEVKSSRP